MKKRLLVISVFLPIMLHAQQNAQWRGENRNGVYNETGLLKVWPADGPELLWHFEGLGAGFTSAAIANEKIYINTLNAFNAETGEMLWSHPIPSQNDINPNIPIYHDGMIFYTTGYRGGAWLFRLTDSGKVAELVWHNKEMDNQMGSAIKVGDYVYGSGHQNNNWFCLNWKTGETVYRVQDVGRSNIIAADGMLYCYSERGTMNLVKPNPEKFELVSSFRITLGTDQHWAHPVIHRGVLYIRHGDALMAYKVK